MLGDYDYGDGRKEKDPNYMTFFDRNTNFPWKSHGVWWYQPVSPLGHGQGRAGLHRHRQSRCFVPIFTAKSRKEMGVAVPKEDMKKETLFDKVEFDPASPKSM